MIAFRYPLPAEGQSQMREVLSRRFRKLAKSLKEFQSLPSRDKDEILNQNIPIMVELQICTFFNPDLMWRDQLSTFIGTQEIETLDRKLKSMEVQGLDDMKINYLDMFHPGDPDLSETFLEIVRDVGSWPQVNNFQANIFCYNTQIFLFRMLMNLFSSAMLFYFVRIFCSFNAMNKLNRCKTSSRCFSTNISTKSMFLR